MTFQVAAYNGYVSVDWSRVQNDFMKQLDLNNDGKVDSSDVKLATQKIVGMFRRVGVCVSVVV